MFILVSVQTAKAEWIKQDVNTLSWLHTIHFVNAEKGWIGGSGGTLLATEDGGKTWKQMPKITSDNIREILFQNKNTGWLLCERDVYSLGTKSPSYLLKTIDGGTSWEKIEFDNKQRQRITSIFFAASGFGLAIGETGALFGLKDDNYTWNKLSPPSSYLMLDGVFTDNLNGAIVGGGGNIFFTEDAGASWNQAFVADQAKAKLNSVYFINKKNGWAAGSKGKIYQTINGGKYWRLQATNTNANLNDVYFANTAEGWAVGDDGTILHSATAGNVWTNVKIRSKHKLEKVVFNGKKGWIVGFGGIVLVYDAENKNN